MSPKGNVIIDFIIDKPCDDALFEKVYRELSKKKFIVFQFVTAEGPVLRVTKYEEKSDLLKKAILLGLTVITVWLTGYWLTLGFVELKRTLGYSTALEDPFIWGLIYTLAFLGVLAMHEYGHIIVSKRYAVPIAGPYFIPAPPAQLGFIGTLGSVISMKNLPPSRRSLILLGLSGPIAGFIGAIVISWIGITLSITIPVDKAMQLFEEGEITTFPYMPLIMVLMMLFTSVKEGYVLVLHPLAFAGFIVFIVTFLNLMPIGQLDGGHVIRGFSSPKTHELAGYTVIMLLIIAGILTFNIGGYAYLFMAGILLVLKIVVGSKPHPGPANMLSSISKKDYALLLLYVLLVVLTLPLPIAGW